MNVVVIYITIIILVLILFFLLKILKNAIILGVLTILAAYLTNKFIYPIPLSVNNIFVYVLIVLSLYFFLEILNLVFNLFDILYEILKIIVKILILPLKWITNIFLANKKKKNYKNKHNKHKDIEKEEEE